MFLARLQIVFLLLWLFAVGPARACQICIPFPTESLADHLLKSSAVVLARENPDAPFTLQTTTVLAGDSSPPSLELFLDSQSRRILANDEEKSIICVYQPAQDPPAWRRVGLDHGALRPLVEEILRQRSHWENQPDARPRFFAPYLRHPDPQIATLAHLEVGRAPYSQIRDLAGAIPTTEIRKYLANIRYAEWHALYILFLAQSQDSEDKRRIVEAIESNAKFSLTLQTAAWATAFIETERSAGLDRLDELYFSNPQRTRQEMDAIHAACSVQGTNSPKGLQDRILESYRLALTHHADLAPRIVADLTKWKRADLADSIVSLLQTPSVAFTPEENLQLRAFVRGNTPDPAHHDPDHPSPRRSYLWLAVGLLLLPYLFRGIRSTPS